MNARLKKAIGIIIPILLCLFIVACTKSKSNPAPSLLQQWDVLLNAKFENPAPSGRTETGTGTLKLYSDNTMKYNITVTGLAASDNLTAAHIHWGDALTNGPVILNFSPSFYSGVASGEVTVRSTLADSIKTGDVYLNVHTTQLPGGLARGQLSDPVDFAADVAMSGANEVSAVNTTATGTALLRLTTGKKLYSKITIINLEANDTLTAAHIHGAAAGVNGSVLQPLCGSSADFGVVKTVVLSDANVTALKTAAVYVNAHSKLHPGGIIRGQIR
jgi:hypothetical protein